MLSKWLWSLHVRNAGAVQALYGLPEPLLKEHKVRQADRLCTTNMKKFQPKDSICIENLKASALNNLGFCIN